jgi:hypothetical protein
LELLVEVHKARARLAMLERRDARS